MNVGIFDFLSRLEPENQKWQQYLELSRQLVLETEPNRARSCEDQESQDPIETLQPYKLSLRKTILLQMQRDIQTKSPALRQAREHLECDPSLTPRPWPLLPWS